jgi:hypothetical protein
MRAPLGGTDKLGLEHVKGAVITTLLGGAGAFFGPFVCAPHLSSLGDSETAGPSLPKRWPLLIGLIFMAFVLFLLKGIWGTLADKLPGGGTVGVKPHVTEGDLMAVKVLEPHHHGIRVNPEETGRAVIRV